MKKRKRSHPAFVRPELPIVGTRILGVDVSTTATGLAMVRIERGRPVADWLSLARPPAKRDYHARTDWTIDRILADLPLIIAPEIIVLEWAEGSAWKSRGRAWTHNVVPMATAQGAVREALRQRYPDATIEHYSSTQWTQSAPKEQRAKWMRTLYSAYDREYAATDTGLDVADALGIATWRLGLGGKD
jgi:hypothetical protein